MKLFARLLALSVAVVCSVYAQPAVNAVLNNASYALPGLSNSGIARGSLFAVFGTGLATGNLTATSFPLSTNMGGTSVKVTVGGTSVDALMIYTTPNQIGAVLPSTTPEGTGQVVVSLNGQASRAASITVVKSAFGTFTTNQAGSGPGAIQIVNSEADRPVVALNRPARPGQTMIVWGTGLGPTTANEAAGPVPGDLAGVNVEVYVGGRRAQVTYRGRSGCCAGIDQIAFVVPAGVEGCFVPVVVKTDNTVSNFSTISVAASGNSCSDPNGMSAQDILTAQNSGTYRVGYLDLSRSQSKMSFGGQSFESKTDSGSGVFQKYELNQLLSSQSAGSAFSVSLGACSVMTFRAETEYVDPVKATPLDAGPFIDVVGPKGAKQMKKEKDFYSAELGGGMPVQPDYLEPGAYKISNGSGGSGPDAVGTFSVDFTLPQMVTWTNETSITTVNRAAGVEVTWTGGDPNGFVEIMGMSTTRQVAAMFICTERASVGRFSVPDYVLVTLPATSGSMPGSLTVSGNAAQKRFTAEGLDAGYVGASSSTQKSVTYR